MYNFFYSLSMSHSLIFSEIETQHGQEKHIIVKESCIEDRWMIWRLAMKPTRAGPLVTFFLSTKIMKS